MGRDREGGDYQSLGGQPVVSVNDVEVLPHEVLRLHMNVCVCVCVCVCVQNCDHIEATNGGYYEDRTCMHRHCN